MTDQELQRALLERLDREPVYRPHRLTGWDKIMFLVCFVLAIGMGYLVFGDVLRGLTGGQVRPTPLPAALPLPTRPAAPPAPQYIIVQQEAEPTVAPQVQIVVTPTFEGCHDGTSYTNGVAVAGSCTGAPYAPEEATSTPEMVAVTAVPLDDVYKDTIRNQAPHCPRCAP